MKITQLSGNVILAQQQGPVFVLGQNMGFVPYGTTSAPTTISATGGVGIISDQRVILFTVSAGGTVPITANPQAAAGSKVGQELRLVGTSNTNAITLSDGNGLSLNGPVTLTLNATIDLWWNGAVWVESDRSA